MDRPGIYTTLNYVHDYMYILPGGGGGGRVPSRGVACLLVEQRSVYATVPLRLVAIDSAKAKSRQGPIKPVRSAPRSQQLSLRGKVSKASEWHRLQATLWPCRFSHLTISMSCHLRAGIPLALGTAVSRRALVRAA